MMSPITGLLLVEGPDDRHVFMNLFQKYNVPKTFDVKPLGGINPMLESLPTHFKGSEVTRLGVVVDADTDMRRRWVQLRNILANENFESIPDEPSADGLVLEGEYGLRVGVWIMPDNSLPGQLEDFVHLMVPVGDSLWPRAQACVNNIPTTERQFKNADLMKAIIHTWLAWQEQPGTPMGSAINQKYLQHDGPLARRFVNWVERVFA